MKTCIEPDWLKLHPEFLFALRGSDKARDKAHPYPPGSGPHGQSCGTCAKCLARKMSKTYYKCRVMHHFWTAVARTDIRRKDPACLAWEPRVEKIEVVTTFERL